MPDIKIPFFLFSFWSNFYFYYPMALKVEKEVYMVMVKVKKVYLFYIAYQLK